MLNIEILEDVIRFKPKQKSKCLKLKSELEVPSNFRRKKTDYEFKYECESNCKLKILIFRDSFTTALMLFVVESFDQSTFIWTTSLNKELIELIQPDIVISQKIERDIDFLMNKNF